VVALRSPDAFDDWASERDDRYERTYRNAYQYANDQVIGVEGLSNYGQWEELPDYGYAWTPARVSAGWAPYSVGHWFWQDPWGWTWISDEPWGWATFHYGRWTRYRSRRYWVPVRPRVRAVRYVPALVEFVRVRDNIGWFPLHPRDRLIPWWDGRREAQNVTYVNRTHVTIVNQDTFVSPRNVSNYIVRDSAVVREATSLRVLQQPLPVPSRSSLRVAEGRERAQRPPTKVLSRAAVVRTAAPPPPPTFQQKLPEIREQEGKPATQVAALEMGLKDSTAPGHRISNRHAAVELRRFRAAHCKCLSTFVTTVDRRSRQKARNATGTRAYQPAAKSRTV
jgi:Family of unknown function (DUF6600)